MKVNKAAAMKAPALNNNVDDSSCPRVRVIAMLLSWSPAELCGVDFFLNTTHKALRDLVPTMSSFNPHPPLRSVSRTLASFSPHRDYFSIPLAFPSGVVDCLLLFSHTNFRITSSNFSSHFYSEYHYFFPIHSFTYSGQQLHIQLQFL